ncbi:MAG: RNase adapter RapZ [Lachnospiraceae bacterium]|nr:RNase adapter RapZ [Lachnospiraceae bacterium]
MDVVILTGMSGAGKSTALKMMEDFGYYCIDNLPIPLIKKFGDSSELDTEIKRMALGIDIRNAAHIEDLINAVDFLRSNKVNCKILFLDADEDTLVRRYKETRRSHPLAMTDRIEHGIHEEFVRLQEIKKAADYILDTSRLLTRDLKAELEKIFVHDKSFNNLFISVLSFGFKYGIPRDADMVFDVRFLPNPYYVEGLRHLSGNDKEVRDFVMQFKESHDFLDKLEDMVQFLIPNFIKEGKSQLVIAVGCTGGKHRSVTLANALFERLNNNQNGSYGVRVEHLDIGKDAVRKGE